MDAGLPTICAGRSMRSTPTCRRTAACRARRSVQTPRQWRTPATESHDPAHSLQEVICVVRPAASTERPAGSLLVLLQTRGARSSTSTRVSHVVKVGICPRNDLAVWSARAARHVATKTSTTCKSTTAEQQRPPLQKGSLANGSGPQQKGAAAGHRGPTASERPAGFSPTREVALGQDHHDAAPHPRNPTAPARSRGPRTPRGAT